MRYAAGGLIGKSAGIRQLFPLIAAVMMTPVSDAYFRILLLTISYPPYITATFFTMGLLFRYMKTPCRRTRVIQLMIIAAFAVLLGTNGLRQLLILYLPLFLGALLLAVLRSPARQGDTLPELDLATGRMLFGGTAALLGACIGMMAALLLWCGNDYYTKLWPRNMTANHEEAVAALRVAGYTEGYATFWNGNIMVELSNGAFDIRVWNPGEELQDPDNVYQWLQETDHMDTHPEGPVFVFLERHELQDILGEHTLDKGTVEFENENYIAYGYPSYDEMRADFFD